MGAIVKIMRLLPPDMVAEIKVAAEAGESMRKIKTIRDAMRHWQRSRTGVALSDEELRRLVTEGRESGEPVDGEGALMRLRAKYETAPSGTRP